jgi:hypothetical protein
MPGSKTAKIATLLGTLIGALLLSIAADAGMIVPCNGQCTWSMEIEGVEIGAGEYSVDQETGAISVSPTGILFQDPGSADSPWVAIDGLSGNIDPILGFSVAAGTGALGKTFAFNFSLPISLSGPIDASSSVSYSLTSLSAAGAQVTPLFGSMVVAQEVDTSVGGLVPLNKGVDVGLMFYFLGGPQVQNSPVYAASNTLTGALAYDLMSVTIAFSLSANSQVGMSGFVQQLPTAVPVPPAFLLLGSSLLALAGTTRSRRRVSPSV